jgi:tetratricopeptide (TPR) repeat protein
MLPSSKMRTTAIIVACLTGFGAVWAQDLDSALSYAGQLVQEHRYQEVIELMTHFEDLDDPEAQYVVAAEIGRAHYHLGDYLAANNALRKAVALRPQRIETALYFQATSYLVGDRDQAYAIFREILASGATDLYLAVTLPGESTFLTDPAVWEILDELATPVEVDTDRGSMLGVELGQPQAEVEDRLGAPSGATGTALTARAGPFLTWAFGFDDSGMLAQIMVHNEHLLRYTPYRLELGYELDWRSTPEVATSALGAPESTSNGGTDVVVMVWRRDRVRLTLEFAPLRPPVPPGFSTDRPVLRVMRMEAVEAEPQNPTPQDPTP